MSDVAILAAVLGVVWTITMGLLGVVWGMLTARIGKLETSDEALVAQNTVQETALGRLTERMIAREEAHAQHREDVMGRLDRLEGKIDQLLRSGARPSPYPGSYSSGGQGESKR